MSEIHKKEVIDSLAESLDVVVTDPPYGLNDPIGAEELAKIYIDTIRTVLHSLKAEGQIVLALPDWSHIGRQIPYFLLRRFVTQQIFAAAEQMGIEVVAPLYTGPSMPGLFKPPYYWESERALRRVIVHFRIRKQAKVNA